MNLAILIGVTEYAAPVSRLPACQNDLALMSKLIKETKKFGDILELGADTSKAIVKTQLAQFVTKHEGTVDELFFYYSGHGDLYKDDFYFLFSDFSDKRRNQTSLTTEELDSMLRTLSPKLTIKVVDACHAGVSYVKEPDALTKQLKVSTGRFSNCYFMFSSQSSQTSLQDDKLSDFTREFVTACTTFRGKDIRYRDIVDHISDAFAGNSDQTPTFVIQAPCVEIFCGVVKSEKFLSDLKDSYRLVAETSDRYDGIPNLAPIGTWIKDKGADFFAKPIFSTETYEVQDPLFSMYLRPGARPDKPIMATREVVSGFDCTAETPFKSVWITAYPLFENLPHAVATVVLVFSKRDCVVFYSFQTVKEIDWGKLAPIETFCGFSNENGSNPT